MINILHYVIIYLICIFLLLFILKNNFLFFFVGIAILPYFYFLPFLIKKMNKFLKNKYKNIGIFTFFVLFLYLFIFNDLNIDFVLEFTTEMLTKCNLCIFFRNGVKIMKKFLWGPTIIVEKPPLIAEKPLKIAETLKITENTKKDFSIVLQIIKMIAYQN